ncbi:hypothetical protein VTK26DRAFT_6640 [Humicola hyalothermophila]
MLHRDVTRIRYREPKAPVHLASRTKKARPSKSRVERILPPESAAVPVGSPCYQRIGVHQVDTNQHRLHQFLLGLFELAGAVGEYKHAISMCFLAGSFAIGKHSRRRSCSAKMRPTPLRRKVSVPESTPHKRRTVLFTVVILRSQAHPTETT